MNIRKTRLWVDCLIWQRPFLRKCLSMGLKILLFIVTQHPVSNLLFSTHQEKSAHRNSAGTVSVAPGEDDVQIPEVRGSWRRSYRPGLGLPPGLQTLLLGELPSPCPLAVSGPASESGRRSAGEGCGCRRQGWLTVLSHSEGGTVTG